MPTGDADFTAWWRPHAGRFLGVRGPGWDRLLGLHTLAHKAVAGRPACDGFLVAGAADHWKLAAGPAGRRVLDGKVRGLGAAAKMAVGGWLVGVAVDGYDGPPPSVPAVTILGVKDAVAAARRVARTDRHCRVPAGWARPGWRAYRVLRPSAVLFVTARQRRLLTRAVDRFATDTGCGLEALALRVNHAGRIDAVAEVVHRLGRV